MATRRRVPRRLAQAAAVTVSLTLACGLVPAGVLATSQAPDDAQKGVEVQEVTEPVVETPDTEGESATHGADVAEERATDERKPEGEGAPAQDDDDARTSQASNGAGANEKGVTAQIPGTAAEKGPLGTQSPNNETLATETPEPDVAAVQAPAATQAQDAAETPEPDAGTTLTTQQSEAAVALGSTAGGSVSGTAISSGSDALPIGGSGNYSMDAPAQVSLTATPDSGYEFVGWYQGVIGGSHFVEGNDRTLVSTSNPYSFTADSGSFTKLQAVFARTSGAGDTYLDNTVDESVSHVIGVVHITGSGGTQAGYSPSKEVFRQDASVTYSNPRTAQVQGMIDAAYTQVYSLANSCKHDGKDGEFHMSTSKSVGAVWDHRQYTTYVYYGSRNSSGDYVYVNDRDPSDTMLSLGAVTAEPEIGDRLHVAHGGYGKETTYRVEANGWVAGYDIAVSTDGFGTGAADLAASLADKTVTLTATPTGSGAFLRWEVLSGEIALADASAATTTFAMPASDVEVRAIFHTHELTKTNQVDPTCTEAGTKAYWTCDECGRMFSDAEGKSKVSAPEEIPALGHDWGEWSDTEGKVTRACSRCGEIETVLVSYNAVAGEGATWTKGSSDGLSFTFKRNVNDDRTFENLKGIQVDGTDVDAGNYVAEKGSVVISLKSAYLEGLSEGDHTLTAVFKDGAADATFTVKPKTANAETEKPEAAGAETEKPEAAGATPPKPTATAPKPSSSTPQTGDIAPSAAIAMLPLACCGIAFIVASGKMHRAEGRGRRNRH